PPCNTDNKPLSLHDALPICRSEDHVSRVREYLKANDMFFNPDVEPTYTEVLELDLSTVEPSLAGPKRPQDLITLSNMKEEYRASDRKSTRLNSSHVSISYAV